ncbi:MAG: DUF512 domain-containing protein [Oscillospiraceae bacterium]|jgi:putative radical SAM enzyme (TIGR03279 family)|nr:DUF512 domain-containing protein [Oscillospiraceae bacterium]
MTTILSVDTSSPAALAGIQPGETLVAINGAVIEDVLDYRFYSADDPLFVETHTADCRVMVRRVDNPTYGAIGLNFVSTLMDRPRGCANRCVFCFIDQLPPGLRESLYFKDDDARLSFLQGNYITLTNLTERELDRIVALRISPIHVSVHTTNPELRVRMMGSRAAADLVPRLRKLADGGITLHCQVVVCPGLNDGEELERTLRELPSNVASVSVVPVGLTRHRENLPLLTPVGQSEAAAIIDIVDRVRRSGITASISLPHGAVARFMLTPPHPTRVYCADELYLKAKRSLPPISYYDDFPQFENGVGMLASFESEFESASGSGSRTVAPFSLATGYAAIGMFERLVRNFTGVAYAIRNDFFGESVDVAGLITGRDLIAQLRGKQLGSRLFIPKVMLRGGGEPDGGGVFLDDVTVAEVERELGVPVIAVENNGESFYKELTT